MTRLPLLALAAICLTACGTDTPNVCTSTTPCQELVCAPEVNYDCEFKARDGALANECNGDMLLYHKKDGYKIRRIPIVCGIKHGTSDSFNGAGKVEGHSCYDGGALVDLSNACPL